MEGSEESAEYVYSESMSIEFLESKERKVEGRGEICCGSSRPSAAVLLSKWDGGVAYDESWWGN